MHFFFRKKQKDLRIWKKSSTFARFFAWSRLKRADLLRNEQEEWGRDTGGDRVLQEGLIGCEKIKYYNTMSKICQITGKKAMGGCNVSHSKRHTKRTFDVNLFRRKFYWVEQDTWIELNVSAAGLRTINKIGLDAALKNAAEKGYLYK